MLLYYSKLGLNSSITCTEFRKEDVGLAYVIHKFDIRGVLLMTIWFICLYWIHINFQRSSFSVRLTLAAIQSLKIVPTSKIHIKPCINLSTYFSIVELSLVCKLNVKISIQIKKLPRSKSFSLLVGTLNHFDIFEVVLTHKSWKEQKISTLHEDMTPD